MIFRKKFSPDLIDLVQYEKDLLYEKAHGIPLRPVVTIPTLTLRNWTDSEMQAMRDNRDAARRIFNDVSGK